MKRLITSILILSTLNAQASCIDVLKSFMTVKKNSFYDSPEFALKEKITKLENINSALRNSSENKEPAMTLAIWKKIEKLDNNLFTKHFSVNVKDWEVFFREFEINYISFKRLKAVLDFLKVGEATEAGLSQFCAQKGYSQEFHDFIISKFKNTPSIELLKSNLDDEINKNMIHLGNNYYEYRLVREHLRDLKGSNLCNAECEKELAKTVSNLGVASESNRKSFPLFLKGESRPDLDELTSIVHENPMIHITRLKKERNQEVINWLISLMLQPEIVDVIMGLVYKSKRLGKYRAVRFFQAFYNAQARNIHFPKINNVVKSFKNDMDKSFAHLKTVNTTVPKDEILVTFARMVDALPVKKWKMLKEYAKANDAKFYTRMLEAEEKAIARGDISITHRRSIIGQLIQFIPASTPIYLYQHHYLDLDDKPTVTEVDTDGNEIDSDSKGGQTVEEVDPVIPIEHGSDMDSTLQEVSEVIITNEEGSRDPSSVKPSWMTGILEMITVFFKGEVK